MGVRDGRCRQGLARCSGYGLRLDDETGGRNKKRRRRQQVKAGRRKRLARGDSLRVVARQVLLWLWRRRCWRYGIGAAAAVMRGR